MAQDPTSPILRFYGGLTGEAAGDHRGRSLPRILAMDDAWLEATHDYIQWLFPLPERSPYNSSAPVLTLSDIKAFGADVALRKRLLDAFRRMLEFYGFEPGMDEQGGRDTAPVARHPPEAMHWISPHNHNFLRISRILRCLHLLGCAQAASGFLEALEKLAGGDAGRIIGVTTLSYWRSAAAGKLLR